uniref:Uncharacterized protein n=1 Tax=Cryptophlebia leucotreta granulosis virus TaxID=35254 RepID=A0A2H4ZKH2_GVCL|nr:hypothetical protein [Cryptophlebia leucotreta granulovirus]
MDNILNYEEQTEWNRLNDVHINITNKCNISEAEKVFIDTIIFRCKEMMTKENKKKVFKIIQPLLDETKNAYEKFATENESELICEK